MLQVGLLTLDDMKFSKNKPIGFTVEGWSKLLDFLKAVIRIRIRKQSNSLIPALEVHAPLRQTISSVQLHRMKMTLARMA